jgi:predicted transcriptional regulator of viral defense system
MRTQQWINFFRKYQEVKIFHFNHLKLLTGISSHNLRISLSRLEKKGLVKRISRGFYANPFNLPTLREISGRIYQPSYISLETVLSEEGVISQIPLVLTCVTLRLPREFRTSFGTIVYHQIKKEIFFGYKNEKGYFFAEKEKAFLDWIYLYKKRYKAFPLLDEVWMEELDREKLKEYALKFPPEIQAFISKEFGLESTLRPRGRPRSELKSSEK